MAPRMNGRNSCTGGLPKANGLVEGTVFSTAPRSILRRDYGRRW